MSFAVDFMLVMLRIEIGGHRECGLELQDLCGTRGGGIGVFHVRESRREKGVMRVVGAA